MWDMIHAISERDDVSVSEVVRNSLMKMYPEDVVNFRKVGVSSGIDGSANEDVDVDFNDFDENVDDDIDF